MSLPGGKDGSQGRGGWAGVALTGGTEENVAELACVLKRSPHAEHGGRRVGHDPGHTVHCC